MTPLCADLTGEEASDLEREGKPARVTVHYPYPQLLPIDRFETAANTLGLCRQERRVTMGRMLRYSMTDIADSMRISHSTVRQYDRSARQRAQCDCVGELSRAMFALMFLE